MTTPAKGLAGPVWYQSDGRAILAWIIRRHRKATVPIAVGANRRTMPGERRLYNTRKGKAVAHRLWRCCHPPGASAVRWHPAVTSRQFQRSTMQTTIERPADSAGELYVKTDISPEQIFQAIGRLRKEARDEVNRLLEFLDRTDVSRELEEDGDAEPSLGCQEAFPGQGRGGGGDDREPDLGSFDRMTDQRLSNRQNHLGEERLEVDAEQDLADREPSLAATETHVTPPYPGVDLMGGRQYRDCSANQEYWASSRSDDREHDDDNGIGDLDGLLEQVGGWIGGGMA